MGNQDAQPQDFAGRSGNGQSNGHLPAAGGNGCECESDRLLVDRCLKGDPAAWSDLFEQCRPGLSRAVRAQLNSSDADGSMVEEITSRVWFSLVKEDKRLLKSYDASRGSRISTYIAGMAKNELLTFLRSERRRALREQTAARYRKQAVNPPAMTPAELRVAADEFLDTLTTRERDFVACQLLGPDALDGAENFSRQNAWQLSHRVRSKLLAYFEESS